MSEIPKVIHYCWFGRGNMPKKNRDCIDSWRRLLPDYEMVLWNEDNFDTNLNRYVREAYQAKKYAFVTDYVRLYVLYHYGGIYMDTDVEVVKSLDPFLRHEAFSGFEDEGFLPTGIIGAKKGNAWIRRLLDEYDSLFFLLPDGNLNLRTNVEIITDIMKHEFNMNLEDRHVSVKGLVDFYPSEFFCPKKYANNEITITENSFVIHHFAGSWLSRNARIKRKIIYWFISVFGPENLEKAIRIKRNIIK